MYEPQSETVAAENSRLRADGGADQISLDDVFSILADRRRRYVLYALCGEEFLSLRELAEQVAAKEANHRPEQLSNGSVDRVKIELHHRHLPQLQEATLVEYDPQIEQITADSKFPLVEKYLTLAMEDEGVTTD